MNKEKLELYNSKLLNERRRVNDLLNQMKDNETTNMNVEMSSELSFYDNHPADLGSEMNDMARGMALKEHEVTIIKKIDDALRSIKDSSYGVCKGCGTEISEERLDFMPYAQYCVPCQSELNTRGEKDKSNRGVEESVLGRPFGYGYNDFDKNGDTGFDAEDSYQSVDRFNIIKNTYENYDDDDDDVEPIEKISNEQYKNQLPD